MSNVVENDSKRLNYTLLTEKYRPATVSDMILPDRLRKLFEKIIEDKDIPNMLFHSTSPGVGKTTLAKALVNDCDFDYLYINNSLDNGINTLRNDIVKFATGLSFEGKKKVVILDEFDGASHDLQKALRGSIEEFHDSCRFICTCNYLTKIIEPLRESRLQLINFDFTEQEVRKEMMSKMAIRLFQIMKKEGIEYDSKQTIGKILKSFYPDLRKMLLLVKQCSDQYGIVSNNIFQIQQLGEEFYEMVLNRKFTDARKYAIEHNINYGEVYSQLKTNLLDNGRIKNGNLYLILNDYDRGHGIALDKELNFAACLIEIFKEM